MGRCLGSESSSAKQNVSLGVRFSRSVMYVVMVDRDRAALAIFLLEGKSVNAARRESVGTGVKGKRKRDELTKVRHDATLLLAQRSRQGFGGRSRHRWRMGTPCQPR